MKRIFKSLGAITLIMFIMASCDGQTGRTDIQEDLVDLRDEMQEVIQTIDEAIATNDISEFKDKTDDAVSSLDNKIDDYLNEMDNAERRIDQNARNRVINMKQKKVEVEFKLALLEQDDYENWGDEDYQYDETRTTGAATGTPTDRANQAPRATPDGTTPGTTTDRVNATDRDTYEVNEREIVYGPQLIDDLKEDLRELRTDVEQFIQASMDADVY
jgi:ElaB/YqjD/DUF883 family membrane-anchored ribosome-binding protein